MWVLYLPRPGQRERSVPQMKTLLLTFALCFVVTQGAHATPQANDSIVIGGNSYGIFQLPMSGYWRYDFEPADARLPFPKFEFTSFANWRGYIAQWSISRGKLHLRSVEGRVAGKMVRDRQIIEKSFPVHARWFTGKIFVSIGDFDDGNKAFEYVLEFNIKEGDVRSTTFHESLKIPMTWNGLPDARPPDEDGTEPSDARETSAPSDLNSISTPRSP